MRAKKRGGGRKGNVIMSINNAGGKCNYHHSGMIMVLISNRQLQRHSISNSRRVEAAADGELSPSTLPLFVGLKKISYSLSRESSVIHKIN